MKNEQFINQLNTKEKRAWKSFVAICENFLGKNKSANYVQIVNEMLSAYHAMGCNMSPKMHYLHSHLNYFPENLGRVSDEQGERFHQELLKMEQRYAGKSKIHMLSNYCWTLIRKTNDDDYKRKRSSKHFRSEILFKLIFQT